MEIIVQKFGGTSVGDSDRIRNVANIIAENYPYAKLVVIVSAMSGVTNSLITQCSDFSKLNDFQSLAEYDAAIASGEVISAALLALQLQNIGIKARSLQSWQIPIITNQNHANAQITEVKTQKIYELLEQGIVPIITGFQGVSVGGNITTLGKGGSDTTAAIITASLKANRCDIYTDVEGIYTADPRIVPNARKINEIEINELVELCSAGAKVLHPRAALASLRYGFDLQILSSFDKQRGTITTKNKNTMENTEITAITSNKNILKVIIHHDHQQDQIISSLMKNEIVIDQIQKQSDEIILITEISENNKIVKTLESLQQTGQVSNFIIQANLASVTLVGYGIKNNNLLIDQIFSCLQKEQIEIYQTEISHLKMSIFIEDFNTEKAIKLLHQRFI